MPHQFLRKGYMMCPTFCFIPSNTPELFNVPSREIENITFKMVFPFTSFSTRILNMKKTFWQRNSNAIDCCINLQCFPNNTYQAKTNVFKLGPETWSGPNHILCYDQQNQLLLFNLRCSDPKLGPDQSVRPYTFSRPWEVLKWSIYIFSIVSFHLC